MVFLFVGSSALTEASCPRDLAIPQLLLSNASIILPLVMSGLTTVFTHRGLSPHQFTPMSGAHQPVQATAACGFVSLLWFLFMCPFCRPRSLPAAVPDLFR